MAIMNRRRRFLVTAPLGLATALAGCRRQDAVPPSPAVQPPATPGAPPAFNTGAGAGPAVSPTTFAEAGKLVQVEMSDAERTMAAGSWRTSMASLLERRTGPRRINLEPTLAPAMQWNPAALDPRAQQAPARDRFVRSAGDPGTL